MSYLKAVLKKDHNTKIAELKNLIRLGKKLKKTTTPDEKKLEILLKKEKKQVIVKTEKIVQKKKTTNNTNVKIPLNNIKQIQTNDNSIIISFEKNINKNIINFFELKQTPYFKDVFDINARFDKVKSTHLKIKNINKVSMGQFKFNIFRLVLTDKKNIKTFYTIKKNKIIITLNEKKSIKKKKTINDKYIDTKNLIRTIYTDENTIRIKFNKNISRNTYKYTRYKTKSSNIYQFDIKSKYKYTNPLKLKINNIDRISVLNNKNKTTRIRIINKKNLNIKYIQNRRELIIKFPSISKKNNTTTKNIYRPRYKSKIIVIDAGHGAKDSGAVGPNKRYEKVVTLQVAKYLYKILKQRGHKVYLTRDKDKFIKVTHRTILANKKRADIFISIHANSVPKSKAKKIEGIETFFLSPARNARAKRVAAKENKSDIRNMSNSSKLVFLESLNRPRITASHKFAIDVQAGMLQSVRTRFSNVKDSGVREGPFWVLVGAQMPSILIELGYISHPKESKRLYNDQYQRLLAKGIATGVDSYFSKNP